jgi:predicted dehydrogenase/threonine dehydrogenase-like Zn-dependent dehydrogenase
MKQVLQEIGTGRTTIAESPAPSVPDGGLCITTYCSLISAGTERMLVEFSRAGWVDKARQQPEKVRQVLDKVRTDGPLATAKAVRGQLDRDLPLGYCNVGVVAAVGREQTGFAVGDRVVSNGPHAEVVAVAGNLCAHIPDEVSDDAAAFTILASIGLQGIRLAEPTIGESFAVIGLGLIGLLTVQILRANGCKVLAIDPDPAKTALAHSFGATIVELAEGEDPVAAADAFTHGRGVDGVLITAATRSNEPVSQAARMCRKRARIILIGVTGLQLNRAEFYEKELTFQVSCSYGPGRYDPAYEVEGQDYPIGFVRWTEQRNFEAALDMMVAGTLNVEPLITHRFALTDAARAYDLLASGSEPYLGILLEYEEQRDPDRLARSIPLASDVPAVTREGAEPVIAMIGSGNYASRVLIPAFAKADAQLFGIASSGGQTAASVGRKFGFAEATSDAAALIADPRVNTVVIATRHDSHAPFVCDALAAGKHVFVEKPFALTISELDAIDAAWRQSPAEQRPLVMVGFNRRFAPYVMKMKSLLDSVAAAKTFVVTVNAGALHAQHWTQVPAIGGGRIIGEACHFIDLMRFLAGAPIKRWQVMSIDSESEVKDDKASITLAFADGSIGTLHYFANGHSSFPKERIEAFCAGKVLQLDNFRRLRGYGWKGLGKMSSWRQDKGQAACAAAFLSAVREGRSAPIAFEELIDVGRVTVEVGEGIRRGDA